MAREDSQEKGVERLTGPAVAGGGGGGRLELICGCMFSGKSLRLIECVREAERAGRRVGAFKHARDTRYDQTQIVSHDGQRVPAIAVGSAEALAARVGEAEVVILDEAQFFEEALVAVCRRLAGEGRRVIVAGLDRDSWGEPFGPVPGLAAVADEVTRTTARCARCGRPADYTQRLVPVSGRTMIGGSESYEPRCGDCFRAPPDRPGSQEAC